MQQNPPGDVPSHDGEAIELEAAPPIVVTEETDRNARAYGWEAATKGEILETMEMSPGNPFGDRDWREKAALVPPKEEELPPLEQQ